MITLLKYVNFSPLKNVCRSWDNRPLGPTSSPASPWTHKRESCGFRFAITHILGRYFFDLLGEVGVGKSSLFGFSNPSLSSYVPTYGGPTYIGHKEVEISSTAPQLGVVDFFFIEYGGLPSLTDSWSAPTWKQVYLLFVHSKKQSLISFFRTNLHLGLFKFFKFSQIISVSSFVFLVFDPTFPESFDFIQKIFRQYLENQKIQSTSLKTNKKTSTFSCCHWQ